MATLGGYNPRGYRGKYSGKAGKNTGRNPQPGFGGGGGGGKSGCPLWLLLYVVLPAGAGFAGVYALLDAVL